MRCCSLYLFLSSMYCWALSSLAIGWPGTRNVSAIKPLLGTASKVSWYKVFILCNGYLDTGMSRAKWLFQIHSSFMLFMWDSRTLAWRQQMWSGKNQLTFRRSFKFLNLSGKKVRCSFKAAEIITLFALFQVGLFCFAICFKMNQKKFYFQRWLRLLKPRELS